MAAIDVAYQGAKRILLEMTLDYPFTPLCRKLFRGIELTGVFLAFNLSIPILFSNNVWAGPSDFFKPRQVSGASSVPEEEVDPVVAPVKKKNLAFSFTKYRKTVVQVCKGLAADGRSLKFFQMLDEHDIRDKECPACKPLISVFSGACRPPKTNTIVAAKKGKKEAVKPDDVAAPSPVESPSEGDISNEADLGVNSEAKDTESTPPSGEVVKEKEPTKEFAQREPNVVVMQGLMQFFGVLSEEEEKIDENAKAVERVVKILRDKEGKTPAEIDYFDFVSHYMMIPFNEYFEKKSPKEQRQGSSEASKAPTPSVESLFE